jgi:hypothetical protein
MQQVGATSTVATVATAAANKEQEHHLFRVRECLVLRKTQIL